MFFAVDDVLWETRERNMTHLVDMAHFMVNSLNDIFTSQVFKDDYDGALKYAREPGVGNSFKRLALVAEEQRGAVGQGGPVGLVGQCSGCVSSWPQDSVPECRVGRRGPGPLAFQVAVGGANIGAAVTSALLCDGRRCHPQCHILTLIYRNPCQLESHLHHPIRQTLCSR